MQHWHKFAERIGSLAGALAKGPVLRNTAQTPSKPPRPRRPVNPAVYKQHQSASADGITVFDLVDLLNRFRARWRRQLYIVVGTTAIALTYLVAAPRIYEAQVLVAPISTEVGEGQLPSLGGGLGRLASLAGLGGAAQGSSIQQNIAVLRSRIFAARFVERHKLAPSLFADQWDEKEGKWLGDRGLFLRLMELFSGTPESPPPGPTEDEIFREFKDIRRVSTDDSTGLVTLSVRWKDPGRAAELANAYVNEANSFIRRHHMSEASDRLEFLYKELSKISLAEIQRSIYQLVANEIEAAMVSNVRKEFAFKIIDPAVIPNRPVWPVGWMVLLMGMIAGVALGLVLIFFERMVAAAKVAPSAPNGSAHTEQEHAHPGPREIHPASDLQRKAAASAAE